MKKVLFLSAVCAVMLSGCGNQSASSTAVSDQKLYSDGLVMYWNEFATNYNLTSKALLDDVYDPEKMKDVLPDYISKMDDAFRGIKDLKCPDRYKGTNADILGNLEDVRNKVNTLNQDLIDGKTGGIINNDGDDVIYQGGNEMHNMNNAVNKIKSENSN